jgi:iron complex transport system substrate-binding protein
MKALSIVKTVAVILIFSLVPVVQAADTITVTDLAGRKVSVPARVEKIAAVTGTLRLVVYLGCIDLLVGIENMEIRYPADISRPYSLALTGKAEKLPVIGEGGAGKLTDMERLLAAGPDVVFTTDPNIAETIRKNTGIPAVVVSYGNTSMLEKIDLFASLRLMGAILKKEKRAKEIEKFIAAFEKEIKTRTKGVLEESKPTVYVGGVAYYGSHGITSTEVMYPPFHWLGARNVADEIGKTGSSFIDKEKLLFWNPDIIFIDTGGMSLVKTDYVKDKDFYRKLKAVKRKRVYGLLPYTYYFTNVEIALANTYAIGKILYPSRFKNVHPLKKADKIFSFFIGIHVLDKLKQEDGYGRILFSKAGPKIEKTF